MSTNPRSGSRGIEHLVERQMRNWELTRAQRLSVPEDKREDVEEYIAISRTLGADGCEVAAKLSEALGWPLFDKEILDAMAGDDAIRRQIYESMDERDLTWYDEILQVLMQPQFVRNDYFHRLTQTVLSIARQGHAVFLGRGTDLILPKDRGLRVRLVAPVEQRARTFAARHGLTHEEAVENVTRIDHERAEFVRTHFGIDPADPARCDLTINLERLSISDAVGLILSARERLGGHRASTGAQL